MNYEEFLIEKYNKVALTKQELSQELGISTRFISDRVRECSAEVPGFIKSGRTTLFPIKEVAFFLENRLIRTI